MVIFASIRFLNHSIAQALVAELAVERFVGAVLPGLARIDVRSVDVGLRQPAQDRSGHELRPVVGSQVLRAP